MKAAIHLDPDALVALPDIAAIPVVGDLVTFDIDDPRDRRAVHGRVEKSTARGWIYVESYTGAVFRLPAKGYAQILGHSPVSLGDAAKLLLGEGKAAGPSPYRPESITDEHDLRRGGMTTEATDDLAR